MLPARYFAGRAGEAPASVFKHDIEAQDRPRRGAPSSPGGKFVPSRFSVSARGTFDRLASGLFYVAHVSR